jgi:hypothetical protein
VEGITWWDDLHKPLETFNDPAWSEKFHVWRMDWDSENIRIYGDDNLLKHTELENTVNREGKSPFRHPTTCS